MITAHRDIKPFAGRLFDAYRGPRKRMRPVVFALCLIDGAEFAPSAATFARAQDAPASAAQSTPPQAPRNIKCNTHKADSTNTRSISPRDAGAIDTRSLPAEEIDS